MTQAAHVGVQLIGITTNAADPNETISNLGDKKTLAGAGEAHRAASPFVL
jgi:hypothetical protein